MNMDASDSFIAINVTVLSIIVLLVLGWNMLNYCQFKKEIKQEMQKFKKKIYAKLSQEENLIMTQIEESTILKKNLSDKMNSEIANMLIGLSIIYLNMKKFDIAFSSMITSVYLFAKCGEFERANEYMKLILKDKQQYSELELDISVKNDIIKKIFSKELDSLEMIKEIRNMVISI